VEPDRRAGAVTDADPNAHAHTDTGTAVDYTVGMAFRRCVWLVHGLL
jgi:hypothetical protein